MMPVRRTQGWLPGILDDFFGSEWVDKASSTAPAVNVIETEKDYRVEVAAPGLTRDDFKIHINEDNELTVSMEKNEEKSDGGYAAYLSSPGVFLQRFSAADDTAR